MSLQNGLSVWFTIGYTIMGKTADLTKQKESLPSIEYIYSKLTYFPEGQQFTKNILFLLVLWSILICSEWIGGFLLNVSQNHHN